METPLYASATTAGALLSTSTFVVPPYQREYAWGVDEVGEFWRDLRGGLDTDSYFLGLVILTEEDDRKHVVDGQQRILTVSLLAAALHSQAKHAGRRALADRIEADFLKSIHYETDEIQARVSLSDSYDDQTFQKLIDASESVDRNASYDEESLSSKLVAAYDVLSERLEKDLNPDPFRRLGLWADFLTNHLYFAVFVHPDPASAYRVFEVINTRGRELTTADLLKNYVLSQTRPADRSALYKEWQKIARQFAWAGPNAFVQFIRHVTTLKAGYILPRDLYDYLSGRVPSAPKEGFPRPSAQEVVESMRQWSPLYLQMIDPTSDGPAQPEWLQVFASLDDLGVISVRPLVMALSRASQPEAGMQQLLRLVVRRIVVGNLGTGNVERRFSEAAREVNQTGDWARAFQELADLNPSREDFIEQLRKRSLNKGTLTFLRRSAIQSTTTPEPVGTLQLIRPRQADDWSGFPEEDFTYWGSTIGNTFLTKSERRSKSSSTWEDFKSTVLPDGVSGEMITELEALEHLHTETAERMGRVLAEKAAIVWFDGAEK